MPDLVERFPQNPIITPERVRPSRPGLEVACVLNPGAFRCADRVGLLLRIAERPAQDAQTVRTPVRDPRSPDGVRIIEVRRDDPDLRMDDPRVFEYRGQTYLTTLSHLRLAWSRNGLDFTVDDGPTMEGEGDLETWGIEDARVTRVGHDYWITYSAVSFHGVGIGMARTTDWRHFHRVGMVFPPDNKDCAPFEELIAGRYWALHRPFCKLWAGLNIWIATSADGIHWGDHRCLARTRPGMWDSERIGAGASPIQTPRGWLEIYHGANAKGRYCLGALLLDRDDPTRVIARSNDPIMEPRAPYETRGFYSDCIFTNGHVVDGDTIYVYYGASDSVVCGARMSIQTIINSLR